MLKCPCFPAVAQLPRYSTPSRSSPKPKQQLQSPTSLRGNSLLLNQLEAVRLIAHTDMCTIYDLVMSAVCVVKTLMHTDKDEMAVLYGAEMDQRKVHQSTRRQPFQTAR